MNTATTLSKRTFSQLQQQDQDNENENNDTTVDDPANKVQKLERVDLMDLLCQDVQIEILTYLSYEDIVHRVSMLNKYFRQLCLSIACDHVWQQQIETMWPEITMRAQPPLSCTTNFERFKYIYTNGCLLCGIKCLRNPVPTVSNNPAIIGSNTYVHPTLNGSKVFTTQNKQLQIHMCSDCYDQKDKNLISIAHARNKYEVPEATLRKIPVCTWSYRLIPLFLAEKCCNNVHWDIGGYQGLQKQRQDRYNARINAIEHNKQERKRKLDNEIARQGVQITRPVQYMYDAFVDGKSTLKSARKWASAIEKLRLTMEREAKLKELVAPAPMDWSIADKWIETGDIADVQKIAQQIRGPYERKTMLAKMLEDVDVTTIPEIADPWIKSGNIKDVERIAQQISGHHERKNKLYELLGNIDTSVFHSVADPWIKSGDMKDIDKIVEKIKAQAEAGYDLFEPLVQDNSKVHDHFKNEYNDTKSRSDIIARIKKLDLCQDSDTSMKNVTKLFEFSGKSGPATLEETLDLVDYFLQEKLQSHPYFLHFLNFFLSPQYNLMVLPTGTDGLHIRYCYTFGLEGKVVHGESGRHVTVYKKSLPSKYYEQRKEPSSNPGMYRVVLYK